MPGHKQKKLKGHKSTKGKAKQPPRLDAFNQDQKRLVDQGPRVEVDASQLNQLNKSFWHRGAEDTPVRCNTSGSTGRKVVVTMRSSYWLYGPKSKYQRYTCVEFKPKCTSEDQLALSEAFEIVDPVYVTFFPRRVTALRNSIQPGVSMAIRAGGSRTP